MSSNTSNYRIVLLVDEDIKKEKETSNESSPIAHKIIQSAALKILTHFAKNVAFENSNLQWGFKFYNSSHSLPKHKFEQHRFSDFDLKSFEDFENTTECRFQVQSASESQGQQDNSHSSQNIDEETCWWQFRSNLRRCLQDIIVDFQWDSHDISSPIKPTRRQLRKTGSNSFLLRDQEVREKHNIIFLFANCPHSTKDVHLFSGNKETPSSLLKALLPDLGFKEFCDVKRIQLNWVDLACLPKRSQLSQGTDGILLINEALKLVQGCVIPVNALLHCGIGPTSFLIPKDLAQKNKDIKECGSQAGPGSNCNLIPTAATIRYYTGHPQNRELDDKRQDLSSCILAQEKYGELVSYCRIQLQGFIKAPTRSIAVSEAEGDVCLQVLSRNQSDNDSIRKDTSESLSSISLTNETEPRSVAFATIPVYHTVVMKACLPQHCLPLHLLQPEDVFIALQEQDASDGDGLLADLVKAMATFHTVLVVDCFEADSEFPSTAVLQPLTSVSVTLTLVKSSMTLSLQKLLAFNDRQDSQNASRNFRTFLRCLSIPASQNMSSLKQDLYEPDTADVFDGQIFRSEMLEEWLMPELNTEHTNTLMDKLGCSPSKFLDDAEIAVLHKIQKKFIQVKSRRLNNMPGTIRRSPRKEAKTPKKSTKSPVTMLSKTPKKTPGKKKILGSVGKKSARKMSASKKAVRRSPRKKVSQKDIPASRRTCRGLLTEGQRPGRHMRGQTAPSRVDLILRKSKEARQRQEGEDDYEDEGSRLEAPQLRRSPRKKPQLQTGEFGSSEEMISHLQGQYKMVVSGEVDGLYWAKTAVQTLLEVCTKTGPSNPQDTCRKMIEENLLLRSVVVRDKYTDPNSNIEDKFREYQCQTVLHMEMFNQCGTALLDDEMSDSVVLELASMLRAMSFVKDPSFLASYLNETLLPCYIGNCGHILYKLYEELLQPLPPVLEVLGSPSSSPESQPRQPASIRFDEDSIIMTSMGGIDSSVNMVSDKTRKQKLRRYSSFHSGSTRQIAMPGNTKPKNEKQQRKSSRIASATKIRPKPAKASPSQSGKVRRNLFEKENTKMSKLSRHNSVAVMEGTESGRGRKSPRKSLPAAMKTPKKQDTSKNKTPKKTPRVHHILKTRSVSETPAHKQLTNLVWRHQEKKRQRAHTVDEVMSIQESPDKALPAALSGATSSTGNTPRRKKATLLRQASFYGNNRSRSVSNYQESQKQNPTKLLSPNWKNCDFIRKGGSLTQSTPNRRVEAKTLFQGILEPSPEKPFGVSFHSPMKDDSVFKDITACFDSPSANTRFQALKSRMVSKAETSARKNLFNAFGSPRKQVKPSSDSAVVDSPSKNTRGQVQSPRHFAEITRIKLASKTTESPKSKAQVALNFKSPEQNTYLMPAPSILMLTPKKSDDSFVKGIADTPSKNTRLQHQLMSPLRNVVTGRNQTLVCTPQKGNSVVVNEATPHKVGHASPVKCNNTPKSRIENARNKECPQKLALFSPQRMTRSMMSPNAKMNTSSQKLNTLTISITSTPPSNKAKRRLTSPVSNTAPGKANKTPLRSPPESPFDKWPRKKSRFPSNFSPGSGRSSSGSSNSPGIGNKIGPSKHTESVGNFDSEIVVENQKDEMGEETIKRKVKRRSGIRKTEQNVANTASEMANKQSEETTVENTKSSESNMHLKRKFMADTDIFSHFGKNVTEGTPTKRRRTLLSSATSSIASGNQSYFESNEVFIETPQLASLPGSVRNDHLQGQESNTSSGSRYSLRNRENLLSDSETNMTFPKISPTKQNKGRIILGEQTNYSSDSESNVIEYFPKTNTSTRNAKSISKIGSLESEVFTDNSSNQGFFPSLKGASPEGRVSPTFPTLVHKQLHQAATSMGTSLPASPIFGSPVIAPKMSPQVSKLTPKGVKKYSPNVSTQSIKHLVESPMLTGGRSKNSVDLLSSPVRAPPTSLPGSGLRSSRRSLYKTKTQSDL